MGWVDLVPRTVRGMSENASADFTELACGDPVLLVHERVLGDRVSEALVVRLTACQVLVRHHGFVERFWRRDGVRVGGRTERDSWTRPDRLEAWDPGRVNDPVAPDEGGVR